MSARTTRPWALVTGGARRLGRVLADAAADSGYAVCVHVNRSVEAGEVAVAALESRGVPACLVVADLVEPGAAAALIDELRARDKTPTLLVNNAAVFEHDRLATATAERFDRHMALNLKAPLLLAQAFAAAIPDAAAGHIVNLVDHRIERTSPHYLSYTLSKAGLWSLTRMLAVELAPKIRVNALAPGLILADPRMAKGREDGIIKGFPMRDGGTCDDLAAAFRYLVGATSVTGEMLCVDGGAHLV